MKILPIRNNILVKMAEDNEEKVGSIIVPGKHKQRTRVAEVVAVGDEVGMEWDRAAHQWYKIGRQYSPGDKVCISFYSGLETDILTSELVNGQVDHAEYRVITENDVLGLWQD